MYNLAASISNSPLTSLGPRKILRSPLYGWSTALTMEVGFEDQTGQQMGQIRKCSDECRKQEHKNFKEYMAHQQTCNRICCWSQTYITGEARRPNTPGSPQRLGSNSFTYSGLILTSFTHSSHGLSSTPIVACHVSLICRSSR
jgi:hypothetical protein